MSEFSIVKLSEIGDTVTGKTPSSNNPDDFGNEFMFITPSDSFDSKYMISTERYLSSEGASKLSKKVLPPNSIMVTCIGSAMGKISMNSSECVTNQQINSIIPNSKYDAEYIYYSLLSNYKLLRNAATGSTALPLLNKSDFDLLEIKVHRHKNNQKQIASALSSLDSKIALNKLINAELEAMAKTIYDYWFVQFDFPNTEGKPYKSSGGKMVWNEELKREVPEGWEVKMLKDIEDDIVTGKTPPTDNPEFYNGNVPFITIGDIRGNMHVVKTALTLSETGGDYQKNKYIPKGSLCVTCIASPGLIAFASETSQTNQQINSIVIHSEHNKSYLYYTLNDYFKFAKGAKTGNTFANMNKGDFESIQMIYPQVELLQKFEELSAPINDRILISLKENQQLSSLRNWLLPMLMNGQVISTTLNNPEQEWSGMMAAEPREKYGEK
jgi:type I restriction enzyme S subunit